MELNQLRYFAAVIRTGSFSAAARECGVAQPSLSQQVMKLEREVGQRLLDRLPRGAIATRAGETLYARAEVILRAVADAKRCVADETESGELRIGAIPTVCPYLMPRMLGKFLRHYPSAEIMVEEGTTRELTARLKSGEIDVGLMAAPVTDDALLFEEVLREELILAVPRGHRLAKKARVSLDDMEGEPFVVLREMHCLGDQVMGVCQRHGAGRVACRGTQLAMVEAMVGMGLGISLIPAMAKINSRRDVMLRELSGARPMRTIISVWNRDRYRTKVAAAFLAAVKREGAMLGR